MAEEPQAERKFKVGDRLRNIAGSSRATTTVIYEGACWSGVYSFWGWDGTHGHLETSEMEDEWELDPGDGPSQ